MQPLTPPQHKIIVAFRTSNYRLPINIGQWLTIIISKDNKLCHFFSYEAHLVLEYPLYNPIRDKFPSFFEKVVLGRLPLNWIIKLTLALFHRLRM